MELPRLYGEFAAWWPLLSSPAEYAEEAALYQRVLIDACRRPARTLLELGSGGGNNASHLKARFEMVLVDRSAGMIECSRALNPECEHVQGDMRTVRLGRRFDCVFIHDAIVYMATEVDLRSALETAYLHCEPGGAALFVPDHVRDSFVPSTGHGGHDGPERGLRYLEWSWDPDPDDQSCTVDYAYLLREPDGSVTAHHDRHIEGLFTRADWIRLVAAVGFEPRVVPFDHPGSEDPLEIFVGSRPVD